MAKCSSCGAEIIFAKTASGKTMPLSVASKQKRVVLSDGDATAMVRDTYLSHFADCPNASQHRKPKDGGKDGAI